MDKIAEKLPTVLDNGLLTAYIAMFIMAIVPIYFGSFASIKFFNRETSKDDEESEYFSMEDAKWFPIIGSGTLFGLYLLFKFFDKEYINYVLTAYFTCMGVIAFAKVILGVSRWVSGLPIKGEYHLQLKGKEGEHYTKDVLSYHFGVYHLIALSVSTLVGAYYAVTKHWIISNIYGEAFATSAIQLLTLDSFKTGMMLLAGLFFYDIFWVFGTEVMVTVAKNFDAPIKVVFPKNFWGLLEDGGGFLKLFMKPEKGVPFTMLGLGDIVIPGIFVALCLQFDYHQYTKTSAGKKAPGSFNFPKPYFISCFIAYTIGLITTVVVMHEFQSAQPALLYLSPACILSALITALIRGEMKEMFGFTPNAEGEKKVSSAKKEKKRVSAVKKDDDENAAETPSKKRRSKKAK